MTEITTFILGYDVPANDEEQSYIVQMIWPSVNYATDYVAQTIMGLDETPDDFTFTAAWWTGANATRNYMVININEAPAAFRGSVTRGWYVNWLADPATDEDGVDQRIRPINTPAELIRLKDKAIKSLDDRLAGHIEDIYTDLNATPETIAIVDILAREHKEITAASDASTVDNSALVAGAVSADYRNAHPLMDSGTDYQKAEILDSYGAMNLNMWNYWSACRARYIGAYWQSRKVIADAESINDYGIIYAAGSDPLNPIPAATDTAINGFLTEAHRLRDLPPPPESAPTS